MFVLGTAVGMAIAIANYRRTGSTEHWPIFIAYGGLSALAAGLLFVLIRALT